ncbi:MAG TPA: hypothetical protein VK742_16275 [Candidatus Sulfotelmatobacter sp.]|jgi:hypothetical protein|nr:hypothetical protein [Candidatus Sulfotelmatobacter sp.]
MADNANNGLNDQAAAVPPPIIATPPPPLPKETTRNVSSLPHLFSILLSLCLGLFLVDAVVSLVDDSLILLHGLHPLTAVRQIISSITALMALGVYGLIGLTPKVPKRLFLPIAFFNLAAVLAVIPFAIYCFDRLPLVDFGFSVCQVILGLILLRQAQGGVKFRWPLVSGARLGAGSFSWKNLSVFVLLNAFVLLPAVFAYLFLCSSLAVDHFSEGFMALHPGGLTVEARKYVRNDGKTIELFPMAHVADADFYQNISRSFPTNSIILIEGVTDDMNLLTNKLSYKRMAKSLGLTEQKQQFTPDRGQIVRADVDVSQFMPQTIACLNLAALVHSQGMTPANIQTLLAYSPTPEFEEVLFNDILTKRNQHLLEEIQSHLTQSDNIMVPWGVAHMPGTARAIQKLGFHLVEAHEYSLIRFLGHGTPDQPVKP